ncbi:uncharacterized protein LOC141673845 [Apium graveolens]|uniref:uncharacterized protein LOC141673845 n=1 Tax=Apium graveolens TaxID=4045 RepID=UPI003D7AC386
MGICNKENVTCFKWKQKGHYSNECPTGRTEFTYFQCGRKEHVARDCRGPAMAASVPKVLALPPSPQHTQPGARTFNMIMKEAVQSPSVIAFQRLGETLIIKLANDDQVPVDQVCTECDIDIAGHHFSVDFILFKLGEFDVILGMDWLVCHNTQIDCANKKVKLRTMKNATVMFRGEKQGNKYLTMMQTK